MDSRSKNEKSIEESMKNLKIDPALKPSDVNMSGPREGSSSDVTSCISSVDATASSIKGSEVDQETFAGDQGMYYYGYCYPGFGSSFGQWDDQSYYLPTDNFEIQPSTAQRDNGSQLYYLPSYQPGYSSYNSIIPGAAVGVEGQYFGQPSYYPSTMLQQPQSFAYGPELVPVYPWDPSLLFANGLQVHGFYADPSFPVPKSSFSSRNQNHVSSKTSTSETKASSVGADVKPKSGNKGSAILSKEYIPISKIPTYPNRNWVGVEQNRGPRTNSSNLVGLKSDGNVKDTYNLPDFSTKYDHALFFVIKSYSEDDVHKSIKYNVWASTPNGNRRLDNAFQLAQEKMAGKGSSCPVFLFFSVNASGQFCGVAEMLDRVNFNKSMDFWQQDKWNGYFPVKWHIIKDVPNPQFRHILLENNENKPVTNSRDTQEVKFPQGTEMLNIFNKYVSKTSILDDFAFYESRQEVMQHKRSKPLELMQVPKADDSSVEG